MVKYSFYYIEILICISSIFTLYLNLISFLSCKNRRSQTEFYFLPRKLYLPFFGMSFFGRLFFIFFVSNGLKSPFNAFVICSSVSRIKFNTGCSITADGSSRTGSCILFARIGGRPVIADFNVRRSSSSARVNCWFLW